MLGHALIYGHTSGPPATAIVFIVLALVMSVLRYRARGRGPVGGQRGRGPGPWGGGGPWAGGGPSGARGLQDGGSSNDPPIHWDIRKPADEDRSGDDEGAGGDAAGEEHNPPSDL
jgi:hypothetical protein